MNYEMENSKWIASMSKPYDTGGGTGTLKKWKIGWKKWRKNDGI